MPRKPTRREQLLRVAVDLFYERGFHATGIDDIGQAAGITGPAIYRHFTGKDDVLSTALEIGTTQIVNRVEAIVAEADTPQSALKGLIRNFVRATLNDPQLASIMLNDRGVFTSATRELVERAERRHLNQWLRQYRAVRPDIPPVERRLIVYATTGMLAAVLQSPSRLARDRQEAVMQEMAEASLFGCAPSGDPASSKNGSDTADPPTIRSQRPQTRRDTILAVAAETFAERGFADTGMDDIGTAAGITGPGVYRHFASKEDLLDQVIDVAIQRLIRIDEGTTVDTASDAAEVLRRAVRKIVHVTRDNAALARVAWREQRSLSSVAQSRLLEANRLRARQWTALLAHVRPEMSELELLTMVSGIYGMLIESVQHDVGISEHRARAVLVDMIMRVVVPC